MGITDKVSGRVKQATGDLLGNEGVRREGADEERKSKAKEQLAREEDRAEQAEARAQSQAEKAEERAEEVSRLERRT